MWEKMGQNGMKERFRGSYIAKIDDRGRVKIPAKYRCALEKDFGKEVYLTSVNGDHILFYRHNDIPMIDSIHYYGHGRPGFKLTSSAADSYDRPLTAVEIYGNYRTFDAAMLYRSGMELFARGANLFLPHGMWYDPQKVRIKPLISHFDEQVGPGLAAYNDWVGRTCLLLQGGRRVADIGVLYPVAAMQAHARLDAVVDQPKVPGNVHPGLYVPPKTDLNELSDCLTGELRRDFTFLHPDILNDRCLVNGPVLRLNNTTNYQDYRVLILPSARVVHASNLTKIRAFCDAGGKVIVTTQVPCKSAEFGRRRHAELLHRVGTMQLDRAFGHVQQVGDLLVEVSRGDAVDDLPFARRQGGESRPQRLRLGAIGAIPVVPLEGAPDGLEEGLALDRLGQEVHRARLHRAHARGDVAVAGEEDHRQVNLEASECSLQLEAGRARQAEVEDHAAGAVVRPVEQELAR